MLLIVLKCLAVLPLAMLRALGTVAGCLVFLVSGKVRRTVTANLAQAGLKLPVGSVVQASARSAIDMIWVWFNPAHAVAARCIVVDVSVREALNQTQATLLLTPHLGCFEALAKWVSVQTPLTAMYRRPDKAWLAQLIETARDTPQLTMARADASGVRLALKTLKTGGTLGILPDQAPRKGEGVWLPWFGRDAYTITLPAKLQVATAARIFILAALPCQQPLAGWRIVCEPIEVPSDLSAEQVTLHLNQALERMVLRDPLHYAWSYKRYKGSPA